MKKYTFLLSLFYTLYGCQTNYKEKTPAQESKCIVEYVGMSRETIIDVSCQSFASIFRDHITQKTFLESNKYFNSIDSTLSFFHPVKEESIDVRLKLVLTKGNVTEVVCMDRFGIFYDSVSHRFGKNEALRKVLFDVTDGK